MTRHQVFPPETGYALEVDGRIKTEFSTREGAERGAVELKQLFRCCRFGCMTPPRDLAMRSSSLLKNLEMESFLVLAGRCWGGAVELDVIF
jgi:hypothetical protein